MSRRVFFDRRSLDHEVPAGFPERPARLERIVAGLERAGMEIEEGGDHPETGNAILEVHDSRYVGRFREAVERGFGFLDTGDNPLSDGTWNAATSAVGVCLRAADWLAAGTGRIAMAAVRPPGHHAERAMAMGFCYFNNVAIAAEYLLKKESCERIAIVDFDVHHGNGTQHLFEERAEVLYASVHQDPFYPGTGAASERGKGPGEGTTVNVPLPAGSGDRRYAEAFGDDLLPALRGFAPQILAISAGFDAWQGDPIGGMRVSREAFETWGGWVAEVADEFCQGRILVTLEGGYDLDALPSLVLAHLDGLASGI